LGRGGFALKIETKQGRGRRWRERTWGAKKRCWDEENYGQSGTKGGFIRASAERMGGT